MNLVSTPDGRIINLDHLTYAERTGEYLVLHFGGGADGGSGSVIRLSKAKALGEFGRILPASARPRSRRSSRKAIASFKSPYAGWCDA